MTRLMQLALLSAFAVSVMTGSATAQQTHVVLGTATPGGGFAQYAVPLVETLAEVDPSLAIEPRSTKGSTDSIPLLEAGKLDIALVAGEPAYEAFEGIGRPRTEMTIVAAMFSMPGMFVVRADSPHKSIGDLVGKPVAFGARSSGLVVLARNMLDGIGLDLHKDFQAVYLDRAGDGTAMLLDGRVAALWGGGVGWPGFGIVARSPAGARFIVPNAGEISRISAKQVSLKTLRPAASRARMLCSRPSVPGASSWRAPRSTTIPPSPRVAPRRGRIRQAAGASARDDGGQPSPQPRGLISSTPARCAICARSASRADCCCRSDRPPRSLSGVFAKRARRARRRLSTRPSPSPDAPAPAKAAPAAAT